MKPQGPVSCAIPRDDSWLSYLLVLLRGLLLRRAIPHVDDWLSYLSLLRGLILRCAIRNADGYLSCLLLWLLGLLVLVGTAAVRYLSKH